MKAPVRVGLYGLLLVVLFLASMLLADALVPAAWVEAWTGGTTGH
ncbi:hypothetical protein [Brachybacterium aquaticum]|uniref:Uncharacterized protein n=1 Tax=Brachybacterium aquaticum TaxID=1432564 RepID=A0A841AD74_9MICO|nr:hypothetical protein [Brachybacterium aquaticum]MBB5831038.1 hypothetical protein [Brachybacterium aquaticum]